MLPKRVLAFIVSTFCFCLLVAMASRSVGRALRPVPITITVDEILREQGQSSDPSLEDLDPRVEMSFDSATKLLTVILSNEASYAGEPDAGHLLTGLGFNLPPDVSIEDVPGRDSSDLSSRRIGDRRSRRDHRDLLSQDDWGYANPRRWAILSTRPSRPSARCCRA